MEHEKGTIEAGKTEEVIIAGVACNVATADKDRVVGLYDATLRGPLEELRKDYIMLSEKYWHFMKSGQEYLAKGIKSTMDAMLEDKWQAYAPNLVTTAGKAWLLNLIGSGSTYTANFMMLISSVGYTTTAVGDTMGTHGGWFEVDATPHFPTVGGTGLRLPVSFSAASGTTQVDKASSAAVAWTIGATGGTVQGCALNLNGTSALGNTTGTLYSAGVFSGGAKVVNPADTLNVSYTTSLAA
jgi:hypothetical protein